jgi:hypothetical protein
MTDTPEGATFELMAPFELGGRLVSKLVCRDLLASDLIEYQRKINTSPKEADVAVLSAISGIPVAGLSQHMHPADLDAIMDVLNERIQATEVTAQQLAEAENARTQTRKFRLYSPVEHGGRNIEMLSLRFPTVADQQAAEKFETTIEQSFAMYASMSGEEIGFFHKITLFDFQRLEAWSAPLFDPRLMLSPTDSSALGDPLTEAAGGTTAAHLKPDIRVTA